MSCTRRDCEDEDEDDIDNPTDPEEERNCRACASMRSASPVCGNDGRTYPSACFAMNCRGLDRSDIVPGPCSRRVKISTMYKNYIYVAFFVNRIYVNNFPVKLMSSASELEG